MNDRADIWQLLLQKESPKTMNCKTLAVIEKIFKYYREVHSVNRKHKSLKGSMQAQ